MQSENVLKLLTQQKSSPRSKYNQQPHLRSLVYLDIVCSKFRPFKCEICNQRYYRKNVLKAHIIKCRYRNNITSNQEHAGQEVINANSDDLSQNECNRSKNLEEEDLCESESEFDASAMIESNDDEEASSELSHHALKSITQSVQSSSQESA